MPLPGSVEKIRLKLRPSGGEDAAAAVAIFFREREGQPELLLVKRAEVPGDPWSGDMAFPGGKRGPGDGCIMDTVLREVLEETNIDLQRGGYLGAMETVYSKVRPGMGVSPLVFLQVEEPEIRINEELTSYHWATLEGIRATRGQAKVKKRETPVFRVDDQVVWGLTYRIIERLLELAEL